MSDTPAVTVDDLPTIAHPPGGWTLHAACRGTHASLFFPGVGEDTTPAKTVCARCPVADQCLDYALDTCQKFGVWGGTSERERRRMRREAA